MPFGRPRSLAEVEAALIATDLEAVNAHLNARPVVEPTIVTSGPVPHGWEVAA